MLEDYKTSKQVSYNKQERKIGRVVFNEATPHSALFNASFAESAVEVDVMAGQGADANFNSKDLSKRILTKVPTTKVTSVNIDQTFCGTAGMPCFKFIEKLRYDISLTIKHGTSLDLIITEWKVARKTVSIPIIVRRALELLSCNYWEMPTAVSDKYDENIDIVSRLATDGNE